MSSLTPVTTFSAERKHYSDSTGNTFCGTKADYAQADLNFLATAWSWPTTPVVSDLPVCKACGAAAESRMESGPGTVTA